MRHCARGLLLARAALALTERWRWQRRHKPRCHGHAGEVQARPPHVLLLAAARLAWARGGWGGRSERAELTLDLLQPLPALDFTGL